MPMDFKDPNFMVARATKVWGWRLPRKGESQEQYRAAFAKYVELSDPEEADAIRNSAVLTKFDPPLVFKG